MWGCPVGAAEPAGGSRAVPAASGMARPSPRGRKGGLGARPGSLAGFTLPPSFADNGGGERRELLSELTPRVKGLLFVSGGPRAKQEHL